MLQRCSKSREIGFMPTLRSPHHGADLSADLAALARQTAYDRYIQALLVKPRHLRHDFLVLAALHGELARIPLLVREPMMGEIRLQWWHDVITATEFVSAGAVPEFGSPLANHVAELIARHAMAREAVVAAIAARRAELAGDTLSDSAAFNAYLDGVGGALLRVGAHLLGAGADAGQHRALDAAGRAVGAGELA